MQWVPRIRYFVSRARTDIMDSILNQLSSGTLSESFSNERINPGMALSMKDSDLVGLGYRVCLSLREFWLRSNEMHEVRTFAPCEVFLFVCLFFPRHLKITGFRTTNVKGKTDHSVSLRWNKKLWSFPKRRVFFWLSIRLICELISPIFARLN